MYSPKICFVAFSITLVKSLLLCTIVRRDSISGRSIGFCFRNWRRFTHVETNSSTVNWLLRVMLQGAQDNTTLLAVWQLSLSIRSKETVYSSRTNPQYKHGLPPTPPRIESMTGTLMYFQSSAASVFPASMSAALSFCLQTY